jgi:hypothetical protein
MFGLLSSAAIAWALSVVPAWLRRGSPENVHKADIERLGRMVRRSVFGTALFDALDLVDGRVSPLSKFSDTQA